MGSSLQTSFSIKSVSSLAVKLPFLKACSPVPPEGGGGASQFRSASSDFPSTPSTKCYRGRWLSRQSSMFYLSIEFQRQSLTAAIAYISTRAPRGNPLTATVDLAGSLPLVKCLAYSWLKGSKLAMSYLTYESTVRNTVHFMTRSRVLLAAASTAPRLLMA